jgi:hypothetical protein
MWGFISILPAGGSCLLTDSKNHTIEARRLLQRPGVLSGGEESETLWGISGRHRPRGESDRAESENSITLYWSSDFILLFQPPELPFDQYVMMQQPPCPNRISWSPIMPSQRFLRLPRGWPNHIKSCLLYAISLAAMALTVARSRSTRNCLQAELDRANNEITLLKEKLAIKDARWSRLPSRRRPHCTPVPRMRNLQVKAARGWSCGQAFEDFMIDEQTLHSWLQRVDEEGENALIQVSEPVNKFPDFVRYFVKQLKVLLPTMGKARIAQVLTRAGRHLGVTTVGRKLKDTEPISDETALLDIVETRVVRAKRPGDVWHIDLTTVPTGAGFWAPWIPFALPQSWPFCWWVGVVVDHFSRAVVGFAIFRDCPTSSDIQRFLNRALRDRRGTKLTLMMGYVNGRRHLPVVELYKAA